MPDADRRRARTIGLVLVGLVVIMLAATAEPPHVHRKIFGLWSARWFFLGLFGLTAALIAFAAARSREALLGTVFTVFAIALTWGVAEAAGRLGVVPYARIFGRVGTEPRLGTTPVPRQDVSGETYQDIATTWGMRSEPMPFHYRTNALGFRNQPDRTSADVILLGDSILVSALTRFEDTVTAQLERRLGRPTLSVALIGISPEREQELFRGTKLPLEGRLVLQFLFEGNDLGDTAEERARAAAAKAGKPPAAPADPAVSDSITRYAILMLQNLTQPVVAEADRRSCWIGDRRYGFLWDGDDFEGRAGEWTHIARSIRSFREEVEAAGGAYGLVIVPAKLRVLAPVCRFPEDSDFDPLAPHLSPLRDQALAFARDAGIPALDLTEPLQASARAGRIPWFWGDTHPNEIGHAVMADALAGWDFVRTSSAAHGEAPDARNAP